MALPVKLSPYQMKIGQLVSLGYCNNDIANELGTSLQAVKSALHAIFDKLGVWNRVELVNLFATHHMNGDAAAAAARLEKNRFAAVNGLAGGMPGGMPGDLNGEPTGSDPVLEKELDDLVMVAATLCNTPIALLTLANEHTLCFRVARGMAAREVNRESSFCEHVIHQSSVMEIQDAAADDRFKRHPFVENDPYIRYYAGAPLLDSDGYALGSLCVLDKVPRQISDAHQRALTHLAGLALRLLQGKPPPVTASIVAVTPMRERGVRKVLA
ncbi:MAG TPA: LuxR C-terminal-related transcriptional regulator [Terriglobales bacterium]|nr:LuxR C-terminal-related transcriptional regulator [Terriglobales bacterium]